LAGFLGSRWNECQWHILRLSRPPGASRRADIARRVNEHSERTHGGHRVAPAEARRVVKSGETGGMIGVGATSVARRRMREKTYRLKKCMKPRVSNTTPILSATAS